MILREYFCSLNRIDSNRFKRLFRQQVQLFALTNNMAISDQARVTQLRDVHWCLDPSVLKWRFFPLSGLPCLLTKFQGSSQFKILKVFINYPVLITGWCFNGGIIGIKSEAIQHTLNWGIAAFFPTHNPRCHFALSQLF